MSYILAQEASCALKMLASWLTRVLAYVDRKALGPEGEGEAAVWRLPWPKLSWKQFHHEGAKIEA